MTCKIPHSTERNAILLKDVPFLRTTLYFYATTRRSIEKKGKKRNLMQKIRHSTQKCAILYIDTLFYAMTRHSVERNAVLCKDTTFYGIAPSNDGEVQHGAI